MTRTALLLTAALLAAGCGGVSAVERCVEHSVEEGVLESDARAGCEEAVGD